MKQASQKGFLIPLVIIIIAVLAIGGGSYVYNQNKKSPSVARSKEVSNNTTASSTQATTTHQTAATSSPRLTDSQFIKVIGTNSDKAEVVARGDINNDGYEDAVVQTVSCGASCAFKLSVVFNQGNGTAKLYVPANPDGAFEPIYNGSGASKSQLTNISIKDGIITLTGNGLDCLKPNTEAACIEKEWDTLKTFKFKFDGKNVVQVK